MRAGAAGRLFCLVAALCAPFAASRAGELRLAITGSPQTVFDSAHDGCDDNDVPDINPRAFRDANGEVVVFALHFTNRAMRGPDLDHLKLDCRVVLASHLDPEPSHYDDRSFIAATWTADGRDVAALIHHEYHADQHDRCIAKGDLACWYNSILAYRSRDGGLSFEKARPLVVASAPFGQDKEQGRHRGFFNPSNIFSDGTYDYFFAATTGWAGQKFGACLFRSRDPADPGSWRAYDGHAFSIRYADPYAGAAPLPKPCAPIAPFVFPVGAVVRDGTSGRFIAVFQATRDDKQFPVDGFYYATSRNLTDWSAAALLLAGTTLFTDLCTAPPSVIAYPSILDPRARGRNFDNVDGEAYLYYTMIETHDCGTGRRRLVRARLSLTNVPAAPARQQ